MAKTKSPKTAAPVSAEAKPEKAPKGRKALPKRGGTGDAPAPKAAPKKKGPELPPAQERVTSLVGKYGAKVAEHADYSAKLAEFSLTVEEVTDLLIERADAAVRKALGFGPPKDAIKSSPREDKEAPVASKAAQITPAPVPEADEGVLVWGEFAGEELLTACGHYRVLRQKSYEDTPYAACRRNEPAGPNGWESIFYSPAGSTYAVRYPTLAKAIEVCEAHHASKKGEPMKASEKLAELKGELTAEKAPKGKKAKAPKGEGAAKAKGTRAGFHDHSVTSVLRWMGKAGWNKKQARAALTALGIDIADGTIQIQVAAGKKGERGEPANLSPAEVAEVEKARG